MKEKEIEIAVHIKETKIKALIDSRSDNSWINSTLWKTLKIKTWKMKHSSKIQNIKKNMIERIINHTASTIMKIQ